MNRYPTLDGIAFEPAVSVWRLFGDVVAVQFEDGFAALAGDRTWPTTKDHFVYCYWGQDK